MIESNKNRHTAVKNQNTITPFLAKMRFFKNSSMYPNSYLSAQYCKVLTSSLGDSEVSKLSNSTFLLAADPKHSTVFCEKKMPEDSN